MEFTGLKKHTKFEQNKKIAKVYSNLDNIINELKNRDISTAIVVIINNDIELINSFFGSNRQLLVLMRRTQSKIIQLLEKQLKLVPKNHYRNLWLALGMAVFGTPIGVAFGSVLGNMSFLGVGIGVGMAIGIAVGTAMDKKALKEGRQLNIEMK